MLWAIFAAIGLLSVSLVCCVTIGAVCLVYREGRRQERMRADREREEREAEARIARWYWHTQAVDTLLEEVSAEVASHDSQREAA